MIMHSMIALARVAAGTALALALGSAAAQSTDAAGATGAAAAAPYQSSDQNVPRSTARKQAAEIATGDPSRWTQEDRDAAARLKTLRKETAAALQESLGNCRKLAQAERAACVKEARATYQQEMAALRNRLASGQ
jgi:hypothetical protein